MSLINAESINNYLEATDVNGIGVSAPIIQEAEDNDFESLRNIQANYQAVNISSIGATDRLITNVDLNDGETVVFGTADNVYIETQASEISPDYIKNRWITVGSTVVVSNNGYTINSTVDSTHLNSQCYSTLISQSFTAKYSFTGTANILGISTIDNKQDNYFASVSTGYAFHLSSGYKYNNAVSVDIGITAVVGDVCKVIYDYNTGEFSIQINDAAAVLLYTLTPNTPVYLAASLYFSNEILSVVYEMDTTAITQGTIPEAFLPNAKLSIVDAQDTKYPIETTNAYSFYTDRIHKVDFFDDGSGIALWTFDGHSNEEGGNYDTFPIGSPTFSGTIPAFPGQTTYYSNQNGAYRTTLVDLPKDVSISLWVYQGNVPSDAYSPAYFQFSIDNQKTMSIISDKWTIPNDSLSIYANNIKYSNGIYTGEYGNWINYMMTSTGRIYKNGVHLDWLDFPAIDMTAVNKEFLIGCHRTGDTTYNDYSFGYIAMVRVFGKGLSSGEAYDLYKSELKGIFKYTKNYEDLAISGREIQTRLELKNKSDKMLSVSGDLWSAPAEFVRIHPVLTDNNDGRGYIAIASSELNTAADAFHLFDGAPPLWHSGATTGISWVKLTLPEAKTISKYTLVNPSYDWGYSPDSMWLYGSNDNTNWTLIATELNIDNIQLSERTAIIEKTIPFLHYKVEFDNDQSYCAATELYLYERT